MAQLHSRRTFVKVFALLTATSACSGRLWTRSLLAEVQPAAQDGGVLRLNVNDFPALLADFGSVRIGTSQIGGDHRPTGLFYPVIINRAARGQFYALDAACTHEGCTVPTYDPSAKVMECPCHGSQYAVDGQVKRGPANFSLRQFPVHFDGVNALAIEISDISFSLESFRVEAAPGRLALEFIAFDQLQYEVRFRGQATADWSEPVPFALTPDGPMNQTMLVGAADFARVYLDHQSAGGFYAVVMRISQV